MKRLLIGSAVAMMLMAGVDDANCFSNPFAAKSRSANHGAAKGPAGHNNAEVIERFVKTGYAEKKGAGAYINEANDAIKIQKQFLAELKKLKTENKKNGTIVCAIEACVKGWTMVGYALESIQHARKKFDIRPDCDEAAAAVRNSTEDLFRKEIVGEEFAKKFAGICAGLLSGEVKVKKGDDTGILWPSGPDQSAVDKEAGIVANLSTRAPIPADDLPLASMKKFYETIDEIRQSADSAAEGNSFGVVGELETTTRSLNAEKTKLSTDVATLQAQLKAANDKIAQLTKDLAAAKKGTTAVTKKVTATPVVSKKVVTPVKKK